MDYYIIRHGETHQSKLNVPYGEAVETAEILPETIPVVEKLANYLKDIDFTKCYSSPYLRCRQTVEIISKITGNEFVFDDRLGEFRPDKESMIEFAGRLKYFLKEVNSKNIKSVLVCTHGYPISALTQLIKSSSVTPERLNYYPKTGVLTIISPDNTKVIDFNKN